MNRVTIELWLWLGKELKGEFQTPSEMRAIKEVHVEEGTTIRDLLDNLAKHYSPIARAVFDRQEKRVYRHVVVNYNDQVTNPHNVHEKVLKDGDKITIFPIYTGG